MRIAVYGLGYVGCVTGACMAEMGHRVIGVDTNPLKVDLISQGKAPIIEEGIQEILGKVVANGMFSGTVDSTKALGRSDLAIVCVGTPSRANGRIDTSHLRRVAEEIGEGLKRHEGYFTVVVRSTVFPGTVEEVVIPTLESRSGKRVGEDIGVCFLPEFLREGSSVRDFFNPPKTVVGEHDTRSGDAVVEIFKTINAPLVRTNIRTAEMLKYADNSFHAVKICFANEIGNVCKEVGVDSHKVMEIFCMDTKLNLSPYYLKPGFAFGGSCLPKDLRALNYEAKSLDVTTPLLSSVLESNRQQVAKVIRKLNEFKGKKIGFLGLSFKGGTDDLRESPIVDVVEAMIGRGYKVLIYDKFVSVARLIGANREYIEKEIPHISSLMADSAKALVEASDVIVISNHSEEFKVAIHEHVGLGQTVIDLVRITEDWVKVRGKYYGICW